MRSQSSSLLASGCMENGSAIECANLISPEHVGLASFLASRDRRIHSSMWRVVRVVTALTPRFEV